MGVQEVDSLIRNPKGLRAFWGLRRIGV